MCFLSIPDFDGQQRTRWTLADRALTIAAVSGANAYNVLFDAITLWPSAFSLYTITVTALTQRNVVLTRETNELALSGVLPDLLAPGEERRNLSRLLTAVYPLLGL